MGLPDRQTKPVFAKADGMLLATALREPSLTLFESPHVMGFLVAQGCHEDSLTGRLQLEGVVGQMLDVTRRETPVPGLSPRLWESAGPWTTLTQSPVIVWKEESDWTARSPTGELIVSTGATPFVVLFITSEDYRQIAGLVKRAMTEAVIAHIAGRLGKIPPQTKILLPRWMGRTAGPTVRITLPPRPKETVRIGLPPKPKRPDSGGGGPGSN